MLKYKSRGDLIIISGTSCAGKGTIIKRLLSLHNDLLLSVSYTTRKKRENELDGVDYYFVSNEEFEQKIKNNELLEYAKVYNSDYYGTPKKEVEKLLLTGKDVILEIDVEGAKQIKKLFPETILIFIMAPSMIEIKNRLESRGSETKEQMTSRFITAYNELNEINNYNYVVVNDDIENAIKKIEAILISEKLRVDRIEELSIENEEEFIHEFLINKDFNNDKKSIE